MQSKDSLLSNNLALHPILKSIPSSAAALPWPGFLRFHLPLAHENNQKCPPGQRQRGNAAFNNCPYLLHRYILPCCDHPHPRPDHPSHHPFSQRPADHSSPAQRQETELIICREFDCFLTSACRPPAQTNQWPGQQGSWRTSCSQRWEVQICFSPILSFSDHIYKSPSMQSSCMSFGLCLNAN